MKTSRKISLVLSLVMCLPAISSCQQENTLSGSSSEKITATVSATDLLTKSSYASDAMLTQTVVLDEDDGLLLQEIVSDNMSQPFGDAEPDTRGTVVTIENIATVYDQFGMEGFVNNPENVAGGAGLAGDKYVVEGKVAHSNGIWTLTDKNSGKEYPWLRNVSYSFWSYAPKEHSGTYTYGEEKARGIMTITGYETPASANNQKDLLVAFNAHEYPTDGKSLGILFRHALADIYFDVSPIAEYGLTVNEITISGANSKGDCEISSAKLYEKVEAGFSWTSNTSADFTMSGAADHFFMIPQNFSGTITISLSNGKTLTTSLATNWLAGKYYLYKLDADPMTYTLIVTGDVTRNYNSTSGPSAYEVTANTDWQLQYSLDDGANWNNAVANQIIGESGKEWIKFDKVSGTASESAVKVNATVSAASGNPETIHIVPDEALNNADPRGTEAAPWDLSMHDIHGNLNINGATTANSYVVSAPGWYAFPLIYGNAIKNGGNNTPAYLNTGGTLSNFIKADGNAINSPYIEGVSSVYPLWEDLPEFVLIAENGCTVLSAQEAANKGLTALNCQYVMFKVEKGKLKQGNVLLAASNGANIVWSWHIWFTASDLTPTEIKNRAGNTFKLLPANLGWVDDFTAADQKGYPEKTLKIRFIQKNAKGQIKNEVYKTPVRKEYIIENLTVGGSSPYWQWGRKDPFIRCNGRNHNEIPSNAYSVHSISEPITKTNYLGTIASSIQNPTIFYSSAGDHDWYGDDGNYRNLWGATNTEVVEGHRSGTAGFDIKPVKTVYDPCPPGYQIPQGNTFTGFINTDIDGTGDPTLFNGDAVYGANKSGETVFLGFKFKTGFGDNTIYIPSVGCRDGGNQGYLGDIPSGGNCWTAVYFNTNHVVNRLYFNANMVIPIGCNPSTNGFQVRPMKEE